MDRARAEARAEAEAAAEQRLAAALALELDKQVQPMLSVQQCGTAAQHRLGLACMRQTVVEAAAHTTPTWQHVEADLSR